MVDVLLIADTYLRTCIGRGRVGSSCEKKIYIYNCHHAIVFFLIWGLHVDILIKYIGEEELRYIYI